jgi:hypothetical protein
MTAPHAPQDGQSVYDFKFETSTRTWKLWTDTIEKLAIPDGAQFSDIIIPTKDSARCGESGMGGVEGA